MIYTAAVTELINMPDGSQVEVNIYVYFDAKNNPGDIEIIDCQGLNGWSLSTEQEDSVHEWIEREWPTFSEHAEEAFSNKYGGDYPSH